MLHSACAIEPQEEVEARRAVVKLAQHSSWRYVLANAMTGSISVIQAERKNLHDVRDADESIDRVFVRGV